MKFKNKRLREHLAGIMRSALPSGYNLALGLLLAFGGISQRAGAQCAPWGTADGPAFEPSAALESGDTSVTYDYYYVVIANSTATSEMSTGWYRSSTHDQTTHHNPLGNRTDNRGHSLQYYRHPREVCDCPSGPYIFEAADRGEADYFELDDGDWPGPSTDVTSGSSGDWNWWWINYDTALTTTTESGWTVTRGNGFSFLNDRRGCSGAPINDLIKGQCVFYHISKTLTAGTFSPYPSGGTGGGMGGGYPPGGPSSDTVALANPAWNYSSSAFSGNIINSDGSSHTYTLYRSTDFGGSWTSLGTYTVGAGAVSSFTDSSGTAGSASSALYRLKLSSTCVGNIVGFTKLATQYNKFTAHSINLTPAAASLSDIFPPAYDWDLAMWNGSGYDYDSCVGGYWDDPVLPFSYLNGIMVKQKGSSAPQPRLCGYVNTTTTGHTFATGYNLAGSAFPQTFTLNSTGAPVGPGSGSGVIAYKYDVTAQTWSTSATWNSGTSLWSSSLSFGVDEGIFLYFPSTLGTWSQSFSPTCP